MAYVSRAGQVYERRHPLSPGSILKFLKQLWAAVMFFFVSLVDPQGAAKYSDWGKRNGAGSRRPGNGPGGGGGGPSKGPRITGIENYKNGPSGTVGGCGGGG